MWIRSLVGLFLLLTYAPLVVAQHKKAAPVCKQSAFRAMRELPELKYECGGIDESDERALTRRERTLAIKSLVRKLELLNQESWWRTSVDDLNACDFLHRPGIFTIEQQQQFESGEYQLRLFGNRQIRLVVVTDPCYQTGFNGSNLFLMYRRAGKTFVTEVIDGYYSRADNSVGLNLATLDGEQLVEITTGSGGLIPSVTNFYFSIEPRLNRAIPKNLFQDGAKATSKISSAALLSDLANLGLPPDAGELRILVDNSLSPSFSTYEDDPDGAIDDNGRKLSRKTYRWNGRIYVLVK